MRIDKVEIKFKYYQGNFILMQMRFRKVVEAEEALSRVEDGSVVAISGFNMATTPEYLVLKLYELYEKTGHPKNLFIISDTLPAAPGRGLDVVTKKLYEDPGQEFMRGILVPFMGWSPWLQKLAEESRIEVYSWSIGIVAYWFREVASGRPGLLTRIGLYTFLDPRLDGGAVNDLARERKTCRVDIVVIDGKEYLFYRAPKPNVALIRGTTADEMGNITMEKEGIFGTVLSIAQAAKAQPNPGLVVAQVERIARFGSLNPQLIQVPGPLIDYVVVAPPEYHWQSATIQFDPRICGRIIPPSAPDLIPKLNLGWEKVIARRVALEIVKLVERLGRPVIVNLGIGIPTYVGSILAEEEISDLIITTIESGPWGGVPLTGPDFGVSIGPFAIMSMPDMFTNYEGGIIDAASLGFLQVGEDGDVNSSMLPDRLPGPGGFPVIAAGSPRVYFAGGFTAGSKEIVVRDGALYVKRDGPIVKFVKRVYKTMFSGRFAVEANKEVLYITERAVFKLSEKGLVLEECAPGVDLEKDILNRMEFRPAISSRLREMDRELFMDKPLGLKEVVAKALRS